MHMSNMRENLPNLDRSHYHLHTHRPSSTVILTKLTIMIMVIFRYKGQTSLARITSTPAHDQNHFSPTNIIYRDQTSVVSGSVPAWNTASSVWSWDIFCSGTSPYQCMRQFTRARRHVPYPLTVINNSVVTVLLFPRRFSFQ